MSSKHWTRGRLQEQVTKDWPQTWRKASQKKQVNNHSSINKQARPHGSFESSLSRFPSLSVTHSTMKKRGHDSICAQIAAASAFSVRRHHLHPYALDNFSWFPALHPRDSSNHGRHFANGKRLQPSQLPHSNSHSSDKRKQPER